MLITVQIFYMPLGFTFPKMFSDYFPIVPWFPIKTMQGKCILIYFREIWERILDFSRDGLTLPKFGPSLNIFGKRCGNETFTVFRKDISLFHAEKWKDVSVGENVSKFFTGKNVRILEFSREYWLENKIIKLFWITKKIKKHLWPFILAKVQAKSLMLIINFNLLKAIGIPMFILPLKLITQIIASCLLRLYK